MDLICAVLRAGAILLTWDGGVYTYPAYKLTPPLALAVGRQAKMVSELLTVLSRDHNPPKY